MAADSKPDLPLEIAHVLFMDVVGYSKLLVNEQRQLQEELSEIVRGTECFRAAEAAGRLVRLPVGDGMALAFFNSPEAPVQCAIEISKKLRDYPHIQLRMGIHSGPVNQITDVNDRTNLAGAGINIAQRVMDCADAGHILLSKRVADDLAQSGTWKSQLHYLGECEVKHGVKVSVVNLYTDEVGNPAPPQKLKKTHAGEGIGLRKKSGEPFQLKNFFIELRRRNVYRAAVVYGMGAWLLAQIATQVFPFFEIPNSAVRLIIIAEVVGFPIAMLLAWIYELTPEGIVRTEDVDLTKPAPRTFGRKFDFVIIGILLLAIVMLIYERRFMARSGEEEIPEKSIAVLPFENFSEEKDNEFFADGIQDDILTSLARIHDLRVISRTSVMSYRAGNGSRNLREIGKVLGVANVLEGSVRRAANRVVVNVQLIDTMHDRHRWANRYDRTLEDSLGLQGELAGEIADALRVTLSPDEKAQVGSKPTRNANAYVFYLRANQISRSSDTLLEDYKTAEQLYLQAIALDRNFALAHARLASVRAEIFHFHEPLEGWKTKARSEAEVALRLQPNLAEGHYALGQCIFWMDEDYARALEEFDKALQLAPNNAEVGALIAAIRRRQGKWPESLEAYEKAQLIDPQNANIARNILITNTAMRRWPEAARAAEHWRKLAPSSLAAKIQSGYIDFWAKGDTHLLKTLLNEVQPGVDPDGIITACRWEIAMLERDYDTAQRVLEASSLTEVDYMNGAATPISFLEGCTLLARGDGEKAKSKFELALPSWETAVKEAPKSAERRANLGLLYALMDRKDDAIGQGWRAIELKPESKDAFDGAIMNCYLALIYTRLGQKDLAFPLIERLLKTPGAVDSVDYSITVNDLKFRWEWDKIRDDPRFQKMIAEATPADQR
jgi:TolB-like protein/class 3 adenylate cyclase/Flp pilus assembly protein TadD